ncbi:serine hydrolase domain-containing protein [Caulobacter sp. KR2-114]|uniref:serine hydrolase domain-containing protein n=1 Tax=Caulobacter sp. KR2-114 TaxID=3400912 RepID=UPI003C006B95
MPSARPAARIPLRRWLPAAAGLIAAAPGLAACGSLNDALGVSSGYAARQLCGAVFVSGQDPDAYYRDALAPSAGPIGPLIVRKVDRAAMSVTVTTAGGHRRTAAFHPGLGCRLETPGGHPERRPAPTVDLPPPAPPLLAPIAGLQIVEPADPALKAALDHAFAETAKGPHRATKAVVVLKDGRVIAERYAAGYGVDTPILGWSMTKSVTNALLGILVRQGRLDMNRPAPVAAWADPKDPRHAITPDNLERMASGLDIGQSMTNGLSVAFDPTTHMVFDTSDMAGFAEKARLKDPPGSRWVYTNGDTLLLSRLIRDEAGGDAASTLRFIHRELFDKLGMTRTTLEFDAAGTFVGASHLWASARDWARFGQLYLDDGVVGGERILPAGWVDYSARPTPGSEAFGYGAGFWTNRGDGQAQRMRVAAGLPADSFMARGSQGQYVLIIPSRHVVIVRMGMAFNDREDIAGLERLTREVLAAAG